jgi:superfamily II DNA/RNA helicase
LGIGELHRKVSEADRAAQLQRFAAGDLRVLICTDVASRGLDTVNVRHVIQADFANDVVTHLHRIGRTARAGREGIVTNFVTRANIPLVSSLLEALGSGSSVDAAFSRRRSFRKQLKKKAIEEAEETAIAKELNMDAAEPARA